MDPAPPIVLRLLSLVGVDLAVWSFLSGSCLLLKSVDRRRDFRLSVGVFSGVFMSSSFISIFTSFGLGSGSGLGVSWKLDVRSSFSTVSRVTFSGVHFIIDLRPPSHRSGVAPFLIGVAGGRR